MADVIEDLELISGLAMDRYVCLERKVFMMPEDDTCSALRISQGDISSH